MTVSSQIIEVLDNLCEKFGMAIDWTAENVLPYLQELCGKYISWEIATSIMWLVLGTLLIIGGAILCILDIKTKLDTFGGALLTVGALVIIAGLVVAIFQVLDILTCCYFPEKHIFEYIKYNIPLQ